MARPVLVALALVGLLLTALPLGGLPPIGQAAATRHGAEAGNGDLTVSVTALRSDRGQVTVFLWRAQDDFADPDEAFAVSSVEPADGRADVIFADLAPGRYALASYHDENADGALDQNWIGWPTEGIGFSRGAWISLTGAPAFDRAAIDVGPGEQRIVLSLRY